MTSGTKKWDSETNCASGTSRTRRDGIVREVVTVGLGDKLCQWY